MSELDSGAVRPPVLELRVLTVGTTLAAAWAAKLLGDLGATVQRVEPPGGSALRRRPPLLDRGESAWFRYLCGRVALLDTVPDPAGEGAGRFDVVLVDDEAGRQLAWPEATVVIDLTAYGEGPYRHWRASELTTWALGGYLYLTGAPDRSPLWLAGGQAALHAGAQAAFAALAALYARDAESAGGDAGEAGKPGQRGGPAGQRIEVSEVASVLAAHVWLVASWAGCGEVLRRVPSDLIRAADGWCYVMRISPNENLFVLIERPDLAAEELHTDVVRWNDNLDRIFGAVADWASDKEVTDIVELGQLLRVAVTPVRDAGDLRDDEQLAARRWWDRDPDTGVRLPGRPYRTIRSGIEPTEGDGAATPAADPATAPAPAQRSPSAPLGGPPGPLHGLRVVEVTNNWAGPLAGRMLADLGADVIKVEWADRPATRTLFWAGPTKDREPDGHERSLYFAELNRNKRDVCIDLSRTEGRDTFHRLIAGADVFIENMSARVMPNLGLDWANLQRSNPRLVMLSMSGYGADGPHRDWVAYGSNIETTCGLTSTTGYHDGVLSRTTLFYADPASGLLGALAVLGALRQRDADGAGRWIDMSLNEVGACFGADALLREAASGVVAGPAANDDPRFAPHGVYRCAGTDNWVAVACQDDADWRRLAAVIGPEIDRADLAEDAEFRTLAGRWARRRELDELLARWAAGRGQYRAARALQDVGIAAAPVLANWQVQADPHVHGLGFFQPIEHPEIGVYPTGTWPWRFERTPGALRRHAPLFAQDNRAVLAEIGLSADEIDELYALGVTADRPSAG